MSPVVDSSSDDDSGEEDDEDDEDDEIVSHITKTIFSDALDMLLSHYGSKTSTHDDESLQEDLKDDPHVLLPIPEEPNEPGRLLPSPPSDQRKNPNAARPAHQRDPSVKRRSYRNRKIPIRMTFLARKL